MSAFSAMVLRVRACQHCVKHLPLGARPVLQLQPGAKILIAGQAPGRKVHETGIPFDDASGNRLREWLGISRSDFYDASKLAILPMGLCYPGRARSGDLPPRPECAGLWRELLLAQLRSLEMTLVIGQYAQAYHFSGPAMPLTNRVKNWQQHWPRVVPLPHPSPRNNIWLSRNSWFETELLPALREKITCLLST